MGPRLTWLDAPAGADESCYIDTVLGITSVLRAIAAARTRTWAYIENGAAFIPTTLLGVSVNPPVLYFEKGPDAALNARLIAAGRIVFVTSDQGVPVQFNCLDPGVATYECVDAFGVTPPHRVLRLQRRSFYRLPGEPAHRQLACEIAVEGGPHASPGVLRPDVLDVSCGGLGAAVSAADPVLECGTRTTCRLDMPGTRRIDATVEVRGASGTVLPNGLPGRRYGMAFVNLAAKSAAAIQRYILEQQRARTRFALKPACS